MPSTKRDSRGTTPAADETVPLLGDATKLETLQTRQRRRRAAAGAAAAALALALAVVAAATRARAGARARYFAEHGDLGTSPAPFAGGNDDVFTRSAAPLGGQPCQDINVDMCAVPEKSWTDAGACQPYYGDCELDMFSSCGWGAYPTGAKTCASKYGIPYKWRYKCKAIPVPYNNGQCSACMPGCELIHGSRDTCDCSKTKFYDELDNAIHHVGEQAKDAWDDAKGFAKEVGDELGPIVDKMNDFPEDALNWFKDQIDKPCDVSPSDLNDAFKTFLDAMKPQDVNKIMKVFSDTPSKVEDIMEGLGSPVCDYIWTFGLPAPNILAQVVKSLSTTLKDKCPLVFDTGKNSAITLGLTMDVNVQNPATHPNKYTASGGVVHDTYSGGMELGVGVDINGNRFCYVGGCTMKGKVLQLKTPSLGTLDVGMAVTVYGEFANVPGAAQATTFGGGIEIPAPVFFGSGLKAEGSLTLMYGTGDKCGEDENEKCEPKHAFGVSIDVEGNLAAASFGVEASFAEGLCYTSLCVLADGGHCDSKFGNEDNTLSSQVKDFGDSVAHFFGEEASAAMKKHDEAKKAVELATMDPMPGSTTVDEFNSDNSTTVDEFNSDNSTTVDEFNSDNSTTVDEFNSDNSTTVDEFNPDNATAVPEPEPEDYHYEKIANRAVRGHGASGACDERLYYGNDSGGIQRCEEQCNQCADCKGFVDNRDASPAYCVFKSSSNVYEKSSKDWYGKQ